MTNQELRPCVIAFSTVQDFSIGAHDNSPVARFRTTDSISSLSSVYSVCEESRILSSVLSISNTAAGSATEGSISAISISVTVTYTSSSISSRSESTAGSSSSWAALSSAQVVSLALHYNTIYSGLFNSFQLR